MTWVARLAGSRALVLLLGVGLAGGLITTGVTRSWLVLQLTLIALVAVAVTLREVRRSQTMRYAFRRITQLERRLASTVDELTATRASLGLLMHDHGRDSGVPPGERVAPEFVPGAVRLLLDRGDVLDAYALAAGTGSLGRLDSGTLRQLRSALNARGYLPRAVDVARILMDRDGEERDLVAHGRIAGEIAVLSGEVLPTLVCQTQGFSSEPGRVLHLVGESLPRASNAYTQRTHHIVTAQRALGLEPHVATPMGVDNEGDDYLAEEVDGVVHHRLPGPSRGRLPLDVWLRTHVQKVADLIQVVRPAVLHAASDFVNAHTAETVGEAFGIPVIYESRAFWEEAWLLRRVEEHGWVTDRLAATHGLPEAYTWRREREDRARQRADRVVALEETAADRIEAGGVPRHRISVIRNPADAVAYLRLYVAIGAVPAAAVLPDLDDDAAGAELLRRMLPAERLVPTNAIPRPPEPPAEDAGLLPGHGIDFRSRPFVCGAIGRWDPAAVDRLRQAAPTELAQLHADSDAVLWGSPGVGRWRSGSRHGLYWSPLVAGPTPDSWHTAAERRLAAGLVIDEDTVLLHSCALGVQELYVRKLGEALYFAVRIDPLLALDAGPISADPVAWASILALGCPLGDATPFAEIRRAVAAGAWRVDRAHRGSPAPVGFEPAWLAPGPEGPPGAGELADLIAAQIPDGDGHRLAVPLSGGWDSRLLAMLANRRASAAPLAWTASTDDGVERDLRLASPVADALGMEHRLVVPGPESWREERHAVRIRLQWQTWYHTWMMPLARILHTRGDPVVDGLAGDVLLRGSSLADDAVMNQPDPKARRLAFAARLTNRLNNADLVAPVVRSMEPAVRSDFMAATDHLDGHPDVIILSQLATRTARAIAASPIWLLGPEAPVSTPFLHPDVLSAALRVPASRRAGGVFYRELLEAAGGPVVASLPSTRDPGQPVPPVPQRQASARAVAAMSEAISADKEVFTLLGPRVAAALTDPAECRRLALSPAARTVLQWAEMLVHWRRRYRDRLVGPWSDVRA